MQKIFITGTGTGVGKTLASALICQNLSNQGFQVAYIKPVQTGCLIRNQKLVAPDEIFVKKISGGKVSTITIQKFILPASPHLAAEQENVQIDIDSLLQEIEIFGRSRSFDFLIIEGAGGLAVPLTADCDMAKFCNLLNAKLWIVTTTTLGTLNHTKLTLSYAEKNCLNSSLIINNCQQNLDIIQQDNLKLLREMANNKIITEIPHIQFLDTESDLNEIKLPKINLNLS